MDFFEQFHAYCAEHSQQQNQLLQKVERATYLTTTEPHMLSGALQGRFLSFISKIAQPKIILEIGTFTGYSALCLAEGLAKNGKLYTIEIDEEKENLCTDFFNESIFKNSIELLIGDALHIIPKLNIKPDLIFIDADKVNYENYYNLCFDLLLPNGIMLFDNTFFKGQVLIETKNKSAKAIAKFNDILKNDNRVEVVMLPLRDGVTMIRKL